MSFNLYVKKGSTKAIQFTDDYKIYCAIQKELGREPNEESFENAKIYGISFHNPSTGSVRIFIGDYLAKGGPGDYYKIDEEFMDKNYYLATKPAGDKTHKCTNCTCGDKKDK